jgi:hypothetical protein
MVVMIRYIKDNSRYENAKKKPQSNRPTRRGRMLKTEKYPRTGTITIIRIVTTKLTTYGRKTELSWDRISYGYCSLLVIL